MVGGTNAFCSQLSFIWPTFYPLSTSPASFLSPLEYPPQISPARYAAARRCQKISRHKLDRIKSRYGTLWPGGTYSAPVLRGNENSQHLVLTQMSYLVSLFRSSENMSFKRKAVSKISFEHAVYFCWKIMFDISAL